MCLKQHTASLCNSDLAFSPRISLETKWCNYTIVLIRLQLGRFGFVGFYGIFKTLLHSLERVTAGIGLHVNAHKMEYMSYNQTGDISTLDGTSLKLVDKFTYLGSSVSSTEKNINKRLTKAWTAIDRLSIIWKSDLTDKMKRSFFQAAVVSILLYGCTTWTITKRLEKKLDGNYTRMLRAILNKSWRQLPTRHQLYGHLPPITKTIQVRQTRHAGHCWRIRDELISDILLWTPTYGRAKAGRPARTYIQFYFSIYVLSQYNFRCCL